MERVQVFTIVAGTLACDAACPHCISQMTTDKKLSPYFNHKKIDERNFKKAANMAIAGGATTALITGKGEPSLAPRQIIEYLDMLSKMPELPIVELQTNGLKFQDKEFYNTDYPEYDPNDIDNQEGRQHSGWLASWYYRGLSTISLSIVSVDDEDNKEFLSPKYPSLIKTISNLHNIGFTVRLNLALTNKYCNSVEKLKRVIKFCKEQGVEQLTVRNTTIAEVVQEDEGSKKAAQWTRENTLSNQLLNYIYCYINDNGVALRKLIHGGAVYDLDGQNICFTSCLTHEPTKNEIRQIIFYSGGLVTYDWQFKGAVLLGWGQDARKAYKE